MAEDIAALNTDNIVASIDAGQLSPGTHEVELVLDLDDNLYHEPVRVQVTVSVEIADDPVPDEPDTGEEPVDEPTEEGDVPQQ